MIVIRLLANTVLNSWSRQLVQYRGCPSSKWQRARLWSLAQILRSRRPMRTWSTAGHMWHAGYSPDTHSGAIPGYELSVYGSKKNELYTTDMKFTQSCLRVSPRTFSRSEITPRGVAFHLTPVQLPVASFPVTYARTDKLRIHLRLPSIPPCCTILLRAKYRKPALDLESPTGPWSEMVLWLCSSPATVKYFLGVTFPVTNVILRAPDAAEVSLTTTGGQQ